MAMIKGNIAVWNLDEFIENQPNLKISEPVFERNNYNPYK